MRYILAFIIGTTFSFLSHAERLSFPDSISAQVVDGKKVIIHKIEPKETWYSVSRKYGVPVKQIQEANPGITGLQIGSTINVPASKRLIKTSTVLGNTPAAPEKAAPAQPRVEERVVTRQAPEREPVQTHTVSAGETMFSIARKYSITVGDIKRWNNLPDENIKLGQTLSVYGNAVNERPAPVTASGTPRTNPASSGNEGVPAYPGSSGLKSPNPNKKKNPYSADPWERLASLADTIVPGKPKVDTSRSVAKGGPKGPGAIPGKPLMPGQKPVTGAISPAAAVKRDSALAKAQPPKKVFETPNLEPAAIPPSQMLKAKRDTAQKALKEVAEQGAASWINDEQVNPNKFYALHRSAPIGTIIKVTNILNKQSVFVKVVGVLQETGDSNVIIKISKAAAKKLGVTESKFQAELSYGSGK